MKKVKYLGHDHRALDMKRNSYQSGLNKIIESRLEWKQGP